MVKDAGEKRGKRFNMVMTDADWAALERKRVDCGARSWADAVRQWLRPAVTPTEPQRHPRFEGPGLSYGPPLAGWGIDDVPFGPAPVKPGSRLKKR